jgi:hypothetical protein
MVLEHSASGSVPIDEMERILDIVSRGPSAFDDLYEESERDVSSSRDGGGKASAMRGNPMLRILGFPLEPLFDEVPAGFERRFLPGYFKGVRKLIGEEAFEACSADARSAMLALTVAKGGVVDLEAIDSDPAMMAVTRRVLESMRTALGTSRGALVWDKEIGAAAKDGSLPHRRHIESARAAVLAWRPPSTTAADGDV